MAPRAEAGISAAATAITAGTIIPGPAVIAEEVTAAIAAEVMAAGAAAMGEAAAIKRVKGLRPRTGLF
jgi:bacterioferritin-associated ferredoxin